MVLFRNSVYYEITCLTVILRILDGKCLCFQFMVKSCIYLFIYLAAFLMYTRHGA